MLNYDELHQLYQRLSLSKTARAVIEDIRSSPPARRVRSSARSVSVRYSSRKMGVTIQAESHTLELSGICEKEYDPDTLEYYDQPSRTKLNYQARSGRSVGVYYTPDFFVIRTDAVGWEEWKIEEELMRLSEKMPHRYSQDENGQWCCPPGERYAERFGFFFRVRSSSKIDWLFQRNIRFLEDYLHPDYPEVNPEVMGVAMAIANDVPGITLDELLRRIGAPNIDDVYRMIVANQIYVDLRAIPLAEPERVSVFRTEETARAYTLVSESSSPTRVSSLHKVQMAAGELITWDGKPWTIANVGETVTTLLAKDGTPMELSKAAIEALIRQGKILGIVEQSPRGA